MAYSCDHRWTDSDLQNQSPLAILDLRRHFSVFMVQTEVSFVQMVDESLPHDQLPQRAIMVCSISGLLVVLCIWLDERIRNLFKAGDFHRHLARGGISSWIKYRRF